MLNLIRKDFLIQLKEKTSLFALVLATAAALLLPHNPTFAVGTIIVATYVITVYLNAYDYKYNAEIAFISLPINRRTIVMGKYVATLLLTILVLLFSMIVSFIFRAFGLFGIQQDWTLPLAGLAILAAALYYTLFFPMYFLLGYMKAKWANYFCLILTYGVLDIIQEKLPFYDGLSQASSLSTFLNSPLFLLFIIGALILFTLSMLFSIKVYERKDF
jgi:ABC-2 type transport system permease protein